MARQTHTNGENMPTISSLTDDINRLSESISRWNAAIIVLMIMAALAATGLVIAQRIAFKKADRLADLTEQRAKLDSVAKDLKISEANDRRVALEYRIADIFGPRQLTPAQSQRIAQKLHGLEGTKIDVYVFALGNPYTAADYNDSFNVALAVIRTLQSVRIDAEGWLLESCYDGSASNVVVGVTGKSDDDRRVASRLIAAFLPEIGTYPQIGESPPYLACTKFSNLDKTKPNKRQHDATINIAIGRKVNPLLTREMFEPLNDQGKP